MAYFDHAANTPVRDVARQAYLDALADVGNPSSVHRHGRTARAVIEDAREQVAAALGCDPIEVVFTSGGTESVNLAVVGLYRVAREQDVTRNVIIVPEGEHHATLETVLWLERHENAELVWIALTADGRIDSELVEQALTQHAGRVALVTMLWANNEVGTIQPVTRVAAACATAGVPLHVDAIAACGHVAIDFAGVRSGAGMLAAAKGRVSAPDGAGLVALSVSGHKIGSVPGVGALIVARDAKMYPVIHGGGQERDLRSGTLAAPAIASLAAAITENMQNFELEASYRVAMRDEIIAKVSELVPEAILRGSPTNRLDNNVNFTFPGCQSDSLLFMLDNQGVSVSTGSACQAGVAQPSHVLMAMGLSEADASSALRITVSHSTDHAELTALFAALPAAYEQAKVAGRT